MQSLLKKFATLLTQDVACRLNGVKPYDSMRGEDAIRLFTELTCHSSLTAEVTVITTSDGAYAVNLQNHKILNFLF